ncbi:MAG: D-alanyl-D-alanine carboxypeptidase/D-alanyl-D-alanine-endopeptidase [Deltaproteobacteria bacterium]|nr:D-alanyl-D-alanine carboxypeptidase/D-alanyl-D-alanine-endopeptidase [Deltaproteobacteria bacterium]
MIPLTLTLSHPGEGTWFRIITLIVLVGFISIPTTAEARKRKRSRAPAPAVAKEPEPPRSAEELLAHSRFADTDVGYLLFDLKDGSMVEAHRPDEPRVPASTFKAVTMIAALEVLGAEYRFATSLFTSGEITENTLRGDVYLRGGGDPTLTTDDLHEFITALQQAGISRVVGNFYFDDSFLVPAVQIEAKQSVVASYNPGLSALSVNYNRIQLHWEQKRGVPTFASSVFSHAKGGAVPVLAISTGMLPSEFDRKVQFLHEETEVDRWLLSPSLPRQGWIELPVRSNPGRVAALLFQTLCIKKGIDLPPPQPGRVPESAMPRHTHWSAPLPEVAAGVLKHSNNLSAELVGQVTSRKLMGRPLPVRESATAVADWYRRTLPNGPWEGMVCANHSGLSTGTRISPRQLAAILRHGWTVSAGVVPFSELLTPPRWERNKGAPIPNVRAKSGTMNYADGLAGYLTTTSGRQLGFAILLTDFAKRLTMDETHDVRVEAGDSATRSWMRGAKGLERGLVASWMARY